MLNRDHLRFRVRGEGLRAVKFAWVLSVAMAIWLASGSLAAAQTFTVLHQFMGADGANPTSPVVRDAAGNLYGATGAGGADYGVIYKVDKSGKESVLLSFNETNGGFPSSDLIFDKSGNLYSTALEGPGGAGILFRLSKGGNEKIIYAFQGGQGSKAAVPYGGPVMDAAGNFYGATLRGGLGVGTIYEIDPNGNLNVLYEFTGGSDGADPQGPLVRDAQGNFYGTAEIGGSQGNGTVFELTTSGKLKVLHSFSGGSDGSSPDGGLLMDKAGNLYGSAFSGGSKGKGTLFEVTKSGKFKVLHTFTGGFDGANPNGGLIEDANGNIYGTAETGGNNVYYGTVFKLSSAHKLTLIYDFTGGDDGSTPSSGLIRDAAGNLYGTTDQNFNFNQRDGTVFKITP